MIDLSQKAEFADSFRLNESTIIVSIRSASMLSTFKPFIALSIKFVILHHDAHHANTCYSPGAVIVNSVEKLRRFYRYMINYRSQRIAFNYFSFIFCKVIVHTIISLAGINQPIGIIQALPE
jgi:hypothetical protein